MTQEYISPSAPDSELINTIFDDASRVHDWRNYVGQRTRKFWRDLTPEQRSALALDAHEMAAREEWD